MHVRRLRTYVRTHGRNGHLRLASVVRSTLLKSLPKKVKCAKLHTGM